MSELQEDLQLLVDSLRYKSDDEEQQRQALQTIATMCGENGNANEHFCEHGGLDLVVQMMKTDGIADGVRQAALYCISAVIEENVGAQMKLCNEKMFQCIYQLLHCEGSSNGMKATAVYLINSLIHNNGTGQNLCRSSKVLLKLINMFKLFVDPLVSTDGASASNNSNMIVKAMAATSTTTDGLELWISVCNTLGSACNNPQNEINQQRCAQLFAGAVSLLRPPVNHKMVRPAVSLLNYCISGHHMNKERIRLVGGLRAMLTLLKEFLSSGLCDHDQLEQAVHLVRLLTTSVTDNGVNQRVTSQLEVVPVLLQLLRNELLDTSQKLCIVMCLAVLSEGNKQIQQQLADNSGFGLLVQVMATSKNDELCRVVIYVLHSCLKEKTATGADACNDQLGDDIERLDAMLNTSYELAKLGPYDGDEQAAHDSHQLIDKEVTVEEKRCHVQRWLDGIGADNTEDTGYPTCDTKTNQQFSYIIPLLQLLFAKGVLDEVRPHLPTSLQNEIDKLCYHIPEDVNDTCDEKTAPCTHVNKKQEELENNTDNTINPTLNCPTNKEVIIAEKELVNNTEPKQGQQDSNFNDNKSLFMDGSTNIMDAESKAADKHKIIKENSLIQCCIDSPRLPRECQMMSETEKEVEKNATKLNLTKHSTNPNSIGLAEEANRVHGFTYIPNLVPASSRDIHHATPCFHQGPKRLLKPITFCLGCAPRPDGIILTSRNYLCSLQSDEHTCPFHRRLVDKHFNSAYHQKSHHTVELSNKFDALTDHDSIYTLTAADCNNSTELQLDETLIDHDVTQLQLDKIETVADHDGSQPLNQDLSRCNNESKGKHDTEATSLQVLQDITNAKGLSVFDYHTPVKQEPRPTQLIHLKPFKMSSSRVEFTPNEEKYIMEGVQKLGKRWRHILNAYPFHPSRTQVNIKDKYRQLRMK